MTYYTNSSKTETFSNSKYVTRDLVNSYLSRVQNIYTLGGNNTSGQLGMLDTTNRSSPVQLPSARTWRILCGDENNTAGITTSGYLYTWGNNTSGQLGYGTPGTNYSSPVYLSLVTRWKTVSVGTNHMMGIKGDGTLWAWGNNTYGQLGKGNTTTYSSPVQVGTLSTWKSVSCGDYFSVMIREDSTGYWATGLNDFGQLGTSDIVNRSSPIQTGSAGTFRSISAGIKHVLSVKDDGGMVACGKNTDGQLGRGNTLHTSSPIILGGTADWSDVFAIGDASFGIRRGGTLWAWGNGGSGVHGTGNITNKSSPVQVGTLTNWYYVSSGPCATMPTVHAIKTDGTLWAWGNNTYGQLGLNDTIHRSSPVQIGSDTDWISASTLHAMKIY